MLYTSNASSSIPPCTLPSYIRILPWTVLLILSSKEGSTLGAIGTTGQPQGLEIASPD